MFKLISCNVFMREVCACIATSPHVVDVEFTELGEHARPERLRATVQAHIDAAADCGKDYAAILLLFGLCGNSTVGLQARGIPLVMPRAHDCCTILLGSRQRFQEHFGDNPSMPFSSAGYMERGNYYMHMDEDTTRIYYGDGYATYVEQYGEENARYIWEAMHPAPPPGTDDTAVFIDLPETAGLGHLSRFSAQAVADGKGVVRLDGDIRLIRGLIHGHWPPDEYLVVRPQQTIAGVYDFAQVVRAAGEGS